MDGAIPSAALIIVSGTLYGATSNGGAYNSAAVYPLSDSK
jgi:hypothetical protein